MAEGRSNAAIAERLVLTVGAVEKHVASISHEAAAAARRAKTTGGSSPCWRTSRPSADRSAADQSVRAQSGHNLSARPR